MGTGRIPQMRNRPYARTLTSLIALGLSHNSVIRSLPIGHPHKQRHPPVPLGFAQQRHPPSASAIALLARAQVGPPPPTRRLEYNTANRALQAFAYKVVTFVMSYNHVNQFVEFYDDA